MTAPKIFGREPAAWVGLIEAVLMTLLAFGIGVGQDTFGPIMGVVVAAFGVFTAWATRDTMLGVIVGLAKSVMVLAAVYGLTLSDEQTGALIAVVTMVVSFYQRTQTSPVADPVDPSPQQVVPVAPPVDMERLAGAVSAAQPIMRHDAASADPLDGPNEDYENQS